MRVPRDMNADDLIALLGKFGYKVARQTGSHIRLTVLLSGGSYSITVPNHSPLKVGTLHAIVKDTCAALQITQEKFWEKW